MLHKEQAYLVEYDHSSKTNGTQRAPVEITKKKKRAHSSASILPTTAAARGPAGRDRAAATITTTHILVTAVAEIAPSPLGVLHGCLRFATEPQRQMIPSGGRAARPCGHIGNAPQRALTWHADGGGAFYAGAADCPTAQRGRRPTRG